MSKTVVARPVNGITLNGELEFLIDDNSKIMVFDSPGQASSLLLANGVGIEDLRHMIFKAKAYEEGCPCEF